MTQHQDLQLLRAVRASEKQHQREQAPNREIDKRPDHPQTSASTTMPRLATANAEIRPARGENRFAPLFDPCYSRARVKHQTGGLKEVPSTPVCFDAPTHRRASAAFAPRRHTMGRAVSNRRDPRRRPSLRTLRTSYRHILTVPGRKTGRPYSTPVDVIDLDDRRWLVAGYGPSNWVRNVRAAGEVTLSRGRRSDRFDVVEADALDAVPVLRKYMTEIRVTRPYFDASPDSHDDDVAAELARHPVFRLIRAASEGGHFSSGSSPPSTGKATR